MGRRTSRGRCRFIGTDVYRLDADRDGAGCEG